MWEMEITAHLVVGRTCLEKVSSWLTGKQQQALQLVNTTKNYTLNTTTNLLSQGCTTQFMITVPLAAFSSTKDGTCKLGQLPLLGATMCDGAL